MSDMRIFKNNSISRALLICLLAVLMIISMAACTAEGELRTSEGFAESSFRKQMADASVKEVKVKDDLVLSSPVEIAGDKVLVGEGSVNAITKGMEDQYLIVVPSGASLTVKGSVSINAQGVIGGVHVKANASLIVDEKASVKNASAKAANSLVEGALTVNGGVISGAQGHNIINKNEVTIAGGEISGSGAKHAGIYSSGKLVQTGGMVTGAYNNIVVLSGGSFDFKGGNNTASIRDGIFVAEGGKLTATSKDAIISDSGARGIYLCGTAVINNITMSDSYDTLIKIAQSGSLELNGGMISKAGYHGIENAGNMVMMGGQIYANTNCGIVNTGTLEMLGGDLIENGNKGILNKHTGRVTMTSAAVLLSGNRIAIGNEDTAYFELAKAKLMLSEVTNIYAVGGTMDVHDIILNAASSNNVRITAGVINMKDMEVRGNAASGSSSMHGILLEGGTVNADNVLVCNTTGSGIRNKGGFFNGTNITIKDSKNLGISSLPQDGTGRDGLLKIDGLVIENIRYNNIVTEGGVVTITNAVLHQSGTNNVKVTAGVLNLQNTQVMGNIDGAASNVHGFYLTGGTTNLTNVSVEHVAGAVLRVVNENTIVNIDGYTTADTGYHNLNMDNGSVTIRNATMGKTISNNLRTNAGKLTLENVHITGHQAGSASNVHALYVPGGELSAKNLTISGSTGGGVRIGGETIAAIDGLKVTNFGTHSVYVTGGETTITNADLGQAKNNNVVCSNGILRISNTVVRGQFEGYADNMHGFYVQGGHVYLDHVDILNPTGDGIRVGEVRDSKTNELLRAGNVTAKNVSVVNAGRYCYWASYGTLNLTDCSASDANIGLRITSQAEVTVNGFVVENMEHNNILSEGGKATISGAVLHKAGTNNIKVSGGYLALTGSEVLGNHMFSEGNEHGIYAERGSTLVVTDTVIRDTTGQAIRNKDSVAIINNVTFHNIAQPYLISNTIEKSDSASMQLGTVILGDHLEHVECVAINETVGATIDVRGGKSVITGNMALVYVKNGVVTFTDAKVTVRDNAVALLVGYDVTDKDGTRTTHEGVGIVNNSQIRLEDNAIGVKVVYGLATVNDSTVSGGKYAVYNQSKLVVNGGSMFNTAWSVYNANGGDATLKDGFFFGNSEGTLSSDIYNAGKLTIENITVGYTPAGVGTSGVIYQNIKADPIVIKGSTLGGHNVTKPITLVAENWTEAWGSKNVFAVCDSIEAADVLESYFRTGKNVPELHIAARGEYLELMTTPYGGNYLVKITHDKLGENFFESFADAFAFIESHEEFNTTEGGFKKAATVQVVDDFRTFESIKIPEGYNITLTDDRVGYHVITNGTKSHMIEVGKGAKLTVLGTNDANSGTGLGFDGASVKDSAVFYVTGGELVIANEVKITNSIYALIATDGNAVIHDIHTSNCYYTIETKGANASVTVNGGTIGKTVSNNVIATKGTITLNDVTIQGTKPHSGNVHGVFARGGNVVLNRVVIDGVDCAALRITVADSTITANDVTISNCNGHGIWLDCGKVVVNGMTMTNCANLNIYTTGGTVELGGTVTMTGSNKFTYKSGEETVTIASSVYLKNSTLNILPGADVTINGNTALYGLQIDGGTMEFAGKLTVKNADWAFLADGGAVVTSVAGSELSVNGGNHGLVVRNADFSVDKLNVTGMKSTSIYMETTAKTVTIGTANLTNSGGNAIHVKAGKLTIDSVTTTGTKGSNMSIAGGAEVTVKSASLCAINANKVNVSVADSKLYLSNATLGMVNAENNLGISGASYVELENVTILGNNTTNTGCHTIYANGSSQIVSTGTLVLTDPAGAGIRLANTAKMTATNVTVNSAGAYAIRTTEQASLTVTGMTTNDAGTYNISVEGESSVSVTNGDFAATTSNNIRNNSTGSLTLTNVIIRGHVAGSRTDVHALFLSKGTNTIKDVTITGATGAGLRIAGGTNTGNNITIQNSNNGISASANMTITGLTMSGNATNINQWGGTVTVTTATLGVTTGNNIYMCGGTLNLNSAEITGGNTITMNIEGGKLNLKDSTVTGGTNILFMTTGVYEDKGTTKFRTVPAVTITGCTFTGATAESVLAHSGTLTITDTTISGAGKGIYACIGTYTDPVSKEVKDVASAPQVTVSNVTVNGVSRAAHGVNINGAGVTLHLAGKLTINDTNYALHTQGASTVTSADGSSLEITNAVYGIVAYNSSVMDLKNVSAHDIVTSAVYVDSTGTVTINGLQVTPGTSGYGATSNAIAVYKGTLNLKGTTTITTTGKRTDQHGIFVKNGTVVIEGTVNITDPSGAGLRIAGGSVDAKKASITIHSAGASGINMNGGTAKLGDLTITDSGDASIVLDNGTLELAGKTTLGEVNTFTETVSGAKQTCVTNIFLKAGKLIISGEATLSDSGKYDYGYNATTGVDTAYLTNILVKGGELEVTGKLTTSSTATMPAIANTDDPSKGDTIYRAGILFIGGKGTFAAGSEVTVDGNSKSMNGVQTAVSGVTLTLGGKLTINNANYALYGQNSSVITAQDNSTLNINGAAYGIVVHSEAQVDVKNLTTSGIGTSSIYSQNAGSVLIVHGATLGKSGGNNVVAIGSGTLKLYDATVDGTGSGHATLSQSGTLHLEDVIINGGKTSAIRSNQADSVTTAINVTINGPASALSQAAGTTTFTNVTITSTTGNGVVVEGGTLTITGTENKINNAGTANNQHALFVNGGTVTLKGELSIDKPYFGGLRVKAGTFDATDANAKLTITNAGTSALIINGGTTKIAGKGLTVSGSKQRNIDIWADDTNAVIEISNATLGKAGTQSIYQLNGTLTLNKAQITGSNGNYTIYVKNGTLNLTGSTIGSSHNAHTIYLDGGVVNMTDVEHQGVTSDGKVYHGIWVNAAELNLTNVTIKNTKNAGLRVAPGAVVTVTPNADGKGLILENNGGHGIQMNGGSLTIDGLKVTNATSCAISIYGGEATIKNATLGNKGTDDVIRIETDGTVLTLENVTITNTVDSGKHPIFCKGGTLNIQGKIVGDIYTNGQTVNVTGALDAANSIVIDGTAPADRVLISFADGTIAEGHKCFTMGAELSAKYMLFIDEEAGQARLASSTVTSAAELSDLLGAAEANGLTELTVTVAGKIEQSSQIVIPAGMKVTFQDDGNAETDNTLAFDLAKDTSVFVPNGELVLDGVVIDCGGDGKLIVAAGQTVTMNNVTFQNAKSCTERSMDVNGGKLNITGELNIKNANWALAVQANGQILAEDAKVVIDSSNYGFVSHGSNNVAKFGELVITNTKNDSVYAYASGTLSADKVSVTGGNYALHAKNGVINVGELTANGTSHGVVTKTGVELTIGNLVTTNMANTSIYMEGANDVVTVNKATIGINTNAQNAVHLIRGKLYLNNAVIEGAGKFGINLVNTDAYLEANKITIKNTGNTPFNMDNGTADVNDLVTADLRSSHSIKLINSASLTVTNLTSGVSNSNNIRMEGSSKLTLDGKTLIQGTKSNHGIACYSNGFVDISGEFVAENIAGHDILSNKAEIRVQGTVVTEIYIETNKALNVTGALNKGSNVVVDWATSVNPTTAISFASADVLNASRGYISLGSIQAAQSKALTYSGTTATLMEAAYTASTETELRDAITAIAATESKTGVIKLTADFTISQEINIPAGCDVTIIDDGTQRTIKRASSYTGASANARLLTVSGKLTLATTSNSNDQEMLIIDGGYADGITVKNSSALIQVWGDTVINKGVALVNNYCEQDKRGHGIYVNNANATLYINGGRFENIGSSQGGNAGVICLANGKLHMTDALFQNNSTNGNGTIEVGAGTEAYISNTVFHKNYAKAGGGAIVLTGEKGVLTVENCTFTENKTDGNGGAIRTASYQSIVNITGCTFKNNVAGANAGAVMVQGTRDGGPKMVTITNCNFESNKSAGGGAIRYNSGKMTFVGKNVFTKNESTAHGGAIYNSSGARITLSDAVFEENKSTKNGGALYVDNNASYALTDCTFTNNTATGDGGVIFLATGKQNVITGCIFDNSGVTGVSAAAGGAIRSMANVTLNISGCTFKGFTVKNYGGALFTETTALTITDSHFENNKTNTTTGDWGGGAILVYKGGAVNISGTEFKNNTAGNRGGALRIHTSSTVALTDCVFTGNTAKAGNSIDTQSDVTATGCTLDAADCVGNVTIQ